MNHLAYYLLGTVPVEIHEVFYRVGPVTDEIIDSLRRMEGQISYDCELWVNYETGDIIYVPRRDKHFAPGRQHALCGLRDIEKTIQWLKDRGTWEYVRSSAYESDERINASFRALPKIP